MKDQFQQGVSLKSYTTFHIGGPAAFWCEMHGVADLIAAVEFADAQNLPVLILGEGSNLLVHDSGYPGMVVFMANKGVERLFEDDETVRLQVQAGERWDDIVQHAVDQGWWGIENMSYIPGTVGAVPIQNVGAYGQEASQVIEAVEVYNLVTRQEERLSRDDCAFAYRSSIFNRDPASPYVVLAVEFRLSKHG